MPALKIYNQTQEISKFKKVLASPKIIDPSFKSSYLRSSAMSNNGPTLTHFEATFLKVKRLMWRCILTKL